jgi:hypothetical protein
VYQVSSFISDDDKDAAVLVLDAILDEGAYTLVDLLLHRISGRHGNR